MNDDTNDDTNDDQRRDITIVPTGRAWAQRWEQKTRPYSFRPQSWQTILKQMGHFTSVTSSSFFWQLTQIIAGRGSIAPGGIRAPSVS